MPATWQGLVPPQGASATLPQGIGAKVRKANINASHWRSALPRGTDRRGLADAGEAICLTPHRWKGGTSSQNVCGSPHCPAETPAGTGGRQKIQNKIEPAMTANGWSNMVEEELLPPTAGDDRQWLVRHAPGVASCQ